jgi:hypothetical protein
VNSTLSSLCAFRRRQRGDQDDDERSEDRRRGGGGPRRARRPARVHVIDHPPVHALSRPVVVDEVRVEVAQQTELGHLKGGDVDGILEWKVWYAKGNSKDNEENTFWNRVILAITYVSLNRFLIYAACKHDRFFPYLKNRPGDDFVATRCGEGSVVPVEVVLVVRQHVDEGEAPGIGLGAVVVDIRHGWKRKITCNFSLVIFCSRHWALMILKTNAVPIYQAAHFFYVTQLGKPNTILLVRIIFGVLCRMRLKFKHIFSLLCRIGSSSGLSCLVILNMIPSTASVSCAPFPFWIASISSHPYFVLKCTRCTSMG